MAFDTSDDQGRAIYQNNVMMRIATDFAMVGFAKSRPERASKMDSSELQPFRQI
jgi:hypothetical protein